MNKNTVKILILLVAFAAAVSLVTFTAFAEGENKVLTRLLKRDIILLAFGEFIPISKQGKAVKIRRNSHCRDERVRIYPRSQLFPSRKACLTLNSAYPWAIWK